MQISIENKTDIDNLYSKFDSLDAFRVIDTDEIICLADLYYMYDNQKIIIEPVEN